MDRVHIESLDVLKAKEQLDLQRRDDVYDQLNKIIDRLQVIPVFPSLMWVLTFDIIKEIFDNSQIKDVAADSYIDEAVPEGITLKQIFDKLWEDIDDFGLNMDSGSDIIEDTIRDWMRENDFLVALDDDGWLDD